MMAVKVTGPELYCTALYSAVLCCEVPRRYASFIVLYKTTVHCTEVYYGIKYNNKLIFLN